MTQFSSISPQALMRLLGTPQAPQVIDVCIDEDFHDDPYLIPTARRCRHGQIGNLAPDLTGQYTVVVCQKGKKLSHGAASVLRAAGVRAEVLEGGMFAWRDSGLPRIPATALPAEVPGSRWVTRWRPKIDRIACPWLIRRFVDPNAKFLYVPPAEVTEVAAKFNATAFDTLDASWGHDGGRCTFDAMIAGFGLSTPALEQMAVVVRAADTNNHDLAPEAAGLLAFSVGLSRAYRDDLAQLEVGMTLYDALYRWARDGKDETHDWKQEAGR